MAKKSYKEPRHKYNCHKSHARARGIEFKMTFEEWFSIWTDSGHWAERGIRRGCYVMARHGDQGAYEVGNVQIVLHEVNSVEAHIGKPMSGAHRAKLRAAMRGRVFTPEQLANMSAAQSVRYSDPEARQQASDKQLAFLASHPEALAKQSTVQRARWIDPELRLRAREKQLAYLARKRDQCPT